jgi:serine/threonine protein kinase
MVAECFGDRSFQCEHYSSAHTDIWSLGVIFVNMISGRNPWARASCRDPCFSAYLDDPHHFFRDILPVSEGVNGLLQRIFHLDPSSRISLTDLRAAIMAMNDFYVSEDDLAHDSHVMRLSDWNYGARVPSDKHSARGSDDACSSDFLSSMIEYEFAGSSGTSARQSDISVGRDQRSGASPEFPRRRLVALNLSPQSSSSSEGESPITPESHAVDPEDVVPDLPAGESLGQSKTPAEISRQANAVKKDTAPFRFISVVRSLMVR